jgi:hypothetical protein
MANTRRPRSASSARTKEPRAQTAKPKVGAKSAFILSFPHDTPSRTIVEAGAAKGLKFTQSYVATIRSLDRKRTGEKATRPVGRPRGRLSAAALRALRVPSAPRSKLESVFASLALDLGLARAEAVLHRVKAHIAQISF